MIGRAYSNISFTEVSQLLGTDNDATLSSKTSRLCIIAVIIFRVSVLKDKSWTVEGDTVYPKPDPLGFPERAESSQDKLTQLVDIVSFLEN